MEAFASARLAAVVPAPEGARRDATTEAASLDRARALERFLAGVERRAFRIASMALRNDEDALDVVQEAMIRLARHYGARPTEEWTPLFYRILNNGIRDFLRRRRVRLRVMSWLPTRPAAEDDASDPVATAPDPGGDPVAQLEGAEALAALEDGLAALPDRQREAFMLRALEGLDVADTAVAMGCSEGSVKTHYFRAVHTLKALLEG